MPRPVVWWLTLAVAACGAFAAAGNAQTPEVPTPKVERIEGERYRVGQIEVDKANMRLTVPATVIDLGSPQAPLEYFAVTKGGFKAYESLLELEANAFEFNLACILIGLEVKDTVVTSLRGRFDPQPTEGDPVAVFVHWESGGTKVRRPATELIRLQDGTSAPDEWMYTGSRLGPQGQFAAQIVGTVIGLMHDPASIIEHRSGVGLGKYGLAGYDPDVVPPAGSRVWLTVERLGD